MRIMHSMLKALYVRMLLLKKRMKIAGTRCCVIKRGVRYDLFTELEGYNVIGSYADVCSSQIGKGSYLGDYCSARHCKIGRFCSIADNVRTGMGTHPSRVFVSTHPAFFSSIGQAGFSFSAKSLFEEMPMIAEGGARYSVVIGNDVWIGSGVRIMDGVRVGDGAIIGAGAIVSKDVGPYEIYAGVPAKKIGDRFRDEEKDFLLSFQWWGRDFDWIRSNSRQFTDITQFIRTFKDVASSL
ncbi:CatB-related O-acetyltransferase [uncultured Vibrio sp.]|uniref:CatB-related O-acetyltransferase n=1 Tax=uncultured Vibrio sp. TaxID=114054 RepID=UPI002AA7BF51|nr:CatB-related O-acetyltransferase [uncultured Vibrio sp.]